MYVCMYVCIYVCEGSKSRGEIYTKNHSHSSPAGEVVEWSEQLRLVTSVWLGAAAVGFESDSAPAGEEWE